MSCPDRIEALNLMLDGELPAGGLADLTRHLTTCPGCMKHFSELAGLRAMLHEAIPETEVPAEFHDQIVALLSRAPPLPAANSNIPAPRHRLYRRLAWLTAGMAVAAMLVFTLMPRPDETIDLAGVRDAAMRSNVSQATNIGAPVAAGFQRVAARSDIVAGHPAQVLTYARSGQTITLCIWPANGEAAHGVRHEFYKGITISYWNDGQREFWAATPGPAAGLDAFVNAIGPA